MRKQTNHTNNNRKCRWFLFLCILSSAVLLTSSCGFIVMPQTAETETEDATGMNTDNLSRIDPDNTEELFAQAQLYLAQLGKNDLGGDYLVIASANAEATAPISNTNAMDQWRLKRNALIESAFHCKIMVLDYQMDTLYEEMLYEKENNTGKYIADLYMIPQKYIGKFAAAGLLANIRTLPYVDLTAPYFDQAAISDTSAGNAVYAGIGDFTYAPEYTFGVYYNRALLETLGGDARQLYRDGNWTWEQFLSLGAAAQANGIWGYTADIGNATMEELVSASSGAHLIEAALDKTPTVHADVTAENAIIQVLGQVNTATSYRYISPQEDTSAYNEFLGGRSLFYIGALSEMEKLSNSAMKWGVLPLPKVSAEQAQYASLVSDAMPLLCVSSRVGDADRTGRLVQALFAASYGYLREYYSQYTLNVLASDNLTAISVGKMTDGLFYDFRTMYTSGYETLANVYGNAIRSGIAVQKPDPENLVSYTLTHSFRARQKED